MGLAEFLGGKALDVVAMLLGKNTDYWRARRVALRALPEFGQRRAARHWLETPEAERLLLSGDEQAAALATAAVIEHVGLSPEQSSVAKTFVDAARQLLEEHRLGTMAQNRRANDELKQSVVAGFQDAFHAAGLDGQPDPAITHARPQDAAGGLLPDPYIGELLSAAIDTEAARRVRRLLSGPPSRQGVEQSVAWLRDTHDANLLEAVAFYCALRRWSDRAAMFYSLAADEAARPERLRLRAAWQYHRVGGVHACAAELDRVDPEGSLLAEVVHAHIEGAPWPRAVLEWRPQGADADDAWLALFVVEALVNDGRAEEALEVVDALVAHRGTATLRETRLEIRRVVALQQDPLIRNRELQSIIQEARQLRADRHAVSLPAPMPTRTLVLAAMQANEHHLLASVADSAFYKEELADDPDIASQVKFGILSAGGSLADLDLPTSAFQERYFDLVGRRFQEDVPSPTEDELRELLNDAVSTTERVRALLLMAHHGYIDPAAVELLEAEDPWLATAVQVAHLEARGDYHAAGARLRPLAASNPAAAGQLALVLEHAGQPVEAAEAALSVWDADKDTIFLEQAARLLADLDAPPPSLVARLVAAYSVAVGALSTQLERELAILEGLFVISMNAGDFVSARSYGERMAELRPNEHSIWRMALPDWAMGEPARAWRTLTADGGPPRPRVDVERRAMATVAAVATDGHEHIQMLLEESSEANDPEIAGLLLLSCQRLLGQHPDPDTLGPGVWDHIRQFTDAHPDASVIRVAKIDPQDPMASLIELVGRRPDTSSFDRQLLTGALPLTMAALATGRTPVDILNQRGRTVLHAAADNPNDRRGERVAAADSLSRSVVLDPTAAHVLGLLLDEGFELLPHFHAICPGTLAQDASVHSNDPVPSGTVVPTGDPDQPVMFIEYSDAEKGTIQARQESIARLVAGVEHRLAPDELTVVTTESGGDLDHFVWDALELAKSEGLPFWCDDASLRALARHVGIRTFGTRAVLDVLERHRHIQPGVRQRAREVLTANYVTDLPSMLSELIQRGEEGTLAAHDSVSVRTHGWWLLSTNADPDRIDEFVALLVNDYPEDVPGWIGSLALGLASKRPESHAIPARFVMYVLRRHPQLRSKVSDVVEAVRAAVTCIGADVDAEALAAAARFWAASEAEPLDARTVTGQALGRSSLGAAVLDALSHTPGDDTHPQQQ